MKRTAIWLLVAVVAALGALHLAQRQLAVLSPALAVHPQIDSTLRESMGDQKRLAELDPDHAQQYRRRFDTLRELHNRLEILRSGQDEIFRSQERIVFALVALTLALIAFTWIVGRRREERRLRRIHLFLERLSSGETHLRVDEHGGDAIAKIAGMIESTSDVIAAERQRLRYLENLSSWQEAARRHAHEIRTPLTAAQLELDRLTDELTRRFPEARALLAERTGGVREELERLRQFTREFTSFAAIGKPNLSDATLAAFIREFRDTYASAWPSALAFEETADVAVRIDRGMLRQVLVNLCSNSALAGASAVRLRIAQEGAAARLQVIDNGNGMDDSVRLRLFQPYVTSRKPGEGMGLGLSISKKIMLDMNGDLELEQTSDRGTTFVITLPIAGRSNS